MWSSSQLNILLRWAASRRSFNLRRAWDFNLWPSGCSCFIFLWNVRQPAFLYLWCAALQWRSDDDSWGGHWSNWLRRQWRRLVWLTSCQLWWHNDGLLGRQHRRLGLDHWLGLQHWLLLKLLLWLNRDRHWCIMSSCMIEFVRFLVPRVSKLLEIFSLLLVPL